MEAIKRYLSATSFFTLSMVCLLYAKWSEWDIPLYVFWVSLIIGVYQLVRACLTKDNE